ncbi:MAG: immune inhibitor A [Candidatus Eiseniibacteriota bacterium]|nr:MAG: immune inhibitor A [Candidatus Eisenbacteria bacterium]
MRGLLILLAGLVPASLTLLTLPFAAHATVPVESGSRLLRVSPAHEVQSDRERTVVPDRKLVEEVMRRRAAMDCFGRPAIGLDRPSGWRFSVSAAETVITVRILALRVDFLEDRMGTLTTTEGGGFDLRRGTGELIDPPPHNRDYFEAHMEALSRYWSAASFGTLQFEYSVFPEAADSAFHLSDTADYGPWTFTYEDYELAVALITDAVRAADDSAEPIVFSDYDAVVIFHSGGELQGDINGDSPWDIPSFTAGLEEPIPVDNSSSYVYAASVLPETASQDGLTGAINGVIAHEFGHMLGLTDLYDTDNFLPSVGYWSLMDTGNYVGGFVENPTTHELVYVFGLLPGGLDPWSRRLLGDVFGVQTQEETVVGSEWADTLFAAGLGSVVLNVPASGSEYFLIENRQTDLDGNGLVEVRADSASGVILGPESGEYDALLPGSGILIWHIDDGLIALRSSRLQTPNGGPEERGIDIEEADGIEDLGNPYSWYWLGSEFDPYFRGNATLFGPATVPNSNANSGARSHVTVDVGSPRQTGMYVSVRRTWAKEGWPVVANSVGPVPGFGDLDGDGVAEVFAAGQDSVVRVWRADGSTYLAGETGGRFAATQGDLLPAVCFSEAVSAMAATATRGDSGILYGWVLDDSRLPLSPGDVLEGWPPAIPSVTTSPCAVGDEFVVGCSDGRVYAIDASGAVAWSSNPALEGPVRGSIAAGDLDRDGVYEVVFAVGERLVAVASSADGEFIFSPLALPESQAAFPTGPFLTAADVDGKPDSTLEVLVTTHPGVVYAIDARGEPLKGWPASLGDSVWTWPAAGDVDRDGLVELVVSSSSGNLYVVNGTGVVSGGWPLATETFVREEASTVALCDLDGDTAAEILFTSMQSQVSAVTGEGARLQNWPVAVGARALGGMMLCDVEGDGKPELFHSSSDTLLWCAELPYVVSACEWPCAGGSGARTNCLEEPATLTVAGGGRLILGGHVHCQPNPARGGSASIRFTLAASATVTMEMFDLSGRKVHSMKRLCQPAENAFLWSLNRIPPGVYLVRVEAEAGGRKELAFTKASVLH